MSVHTTTGRWRLGILLSICTAFLWATAPIALKVLLEGMGPFTIVWYRLLISVALMLPLVLYRRGLPDKSAFRGRVVLIFLAAVLGLCANYGLFQYGLNFIPPSTAVVVIQLAPLFMLLGSVAVFKERYSPRQFTGLIILVSGLALFFNKRLIDLFANFDQYTLGVIMIVGAALLWSIYALAQKQLLKSLPSETIMTMIYVCGAILFLPMASPREIFDLDALKLVLLVFCGFNTIIAYGCFSEALDHLEASRVSAVLATIPLITLATMKLLAMFYPGFIPREPLNALSIAGALMVVSGSMISSLSRASEIQEPGQGPVI